MWHRAAARWWPSARSPAWGAGHSSPPILSAAGAYATAAGAGGEQAGRGHCTPGEFPQRNPSREQRCRQKGFSDPLNERSEAPGSRAAAFLLKRAKRTHSPIPRARSPTRARSNSEVHPHSPSRSPSPLALPRRRSTLNLTAAAGLRAGRSLA